jgi:hypothetical protein
MGGTTPLNPSSPPVVCEKCRERPATVEFVDETTVQPTVRLILCDSCSDAETGRMVGRMMASAGKGFPSGFPNNLTDDQLRDLMVRFRDPANWE